MSPNKETELLELLIDYMHKSALERKTPDLPKGLEKNAKLQEYHGIMSDIRVILQRISAGDMSQDFDGTGHLLGLCKGLQSKLRHLIWQVEQVEKGDYTQRVDFLGEFSDAFNSMIDQLNNSIHTIIQKEEALVVLAHTLQKEVQKRTRKSAIALRRLKINENRLRYQAQHDALTGTMNRRTFVEFASSRLESGISIGLACTVCMMDLDHFEVINDTYGHQVGDQVLKHVVEKCELCLRQSDIIARYGGEEFVFLFPDADLRQASAIAERMRKKIEETPYTHQGEAIHVTASFGLSDAPNPGLHLKGKSLLKYMVKRADNALYKAKREGRNRVVPIPSE